MRKKRLKTHSLQPQGEWRLSSASLVPSPNSSSLSLHIPTIPLSAGRNPCFLFYQITGAGQHQLTLPSPPTSFLHLHLSTAPSFLHQRATCLPCSLPLVHAFSLLPSPILEPSVHILTSLLSSISLLVLSNYP